ncbi:unnamed protein product [Caenorhabditis brenneri]
MSSVNTTVAVCDEKMVLALQSSTFLHVSELIMLILSVIAIPVLVVTMKKFVIAGVFHVNMRMIVAVHCLSILMHCIGRIIQHTSDFYLWVAPIPICDKRSFLNWCLVSRSLYTFGIYCSSFTSVFVVIERTIATKLSKKYEDKKASIGILLVLSQISLSVVITLFLYFGSVVPERPGYCFLNSRKDWSVFVELASMTANGLGLVQCLRIYTINIKLRTTFALSDLSQKYQIEENKTLSKALLWFISLDFVFMTNYFLFSFLMETFYSDKADAFFYAIFELIHCVPVYALVVFPSMAKVLKSVHREKTVQLTAQVRVKDEAYFYYLKEQWTHRK